MQASKFDLVIIGGGLVGLASAYQLSLKFPKKKILVLEKEKDLASHQSSRNSGVIHSGIYYKPGSLKAQNCLRGYAMLLDFMNQYEISHEVCGKIILATEEKELANLKMLYERGISHGLSKIRYLDDLKSIQEIEPHARGLAAIHVPYAGIADYPAVARKLGELLEANGGKVARSQEVEKIEKKNSEWRINTKTGMTVESSFLIDAAGLYSDRIAKAMGIISATKIVPFRGEYYVMKKEACSKIKHLIYPVPNLEFPFLGVHFTRMIHGGVEAGPNAVLALHREGYNWSTISVRDTLDSLCFPGFWKLAAKHASYGWSEIQRSFSKKLFVQSLQRLVPSVEESDFEVGDAGIRAQALRADGSLVDDFCIERIENGLAVLNAPSPAATSSLSIGKSIADLISE